LKSVTKVAAASGRFGREPLQLLRFSGRIAAGKEDLGGGIQLVAGRPLFFFAVASPPAMYADLEESSLIA
jgi:hypothetical protein